MKTLLPLPIALLCAFACEEGVILTGNVTVPVDVQALFSKEAPGRVVIRAGRADSLLLIETVAVLCAPESEPIQIPIASKALGCARESRVEALVDRLPADQKLPCGSVSAKTGGLLRERVVASAEQTIFPGKNPSSCDSGEASFSLTVRPVTTNVSP